MSIPTVLVTGFLGAGKTTLINRVLNDPGDRRLAVIVNDFGAIDIDAQILESANAEIVSLKNGCICCSIQGDLFQTLKVLLDRDAKPDGLVIETSGVSDPAEIVRSLLDPFVWQIAALDSVICVVDAREMLREPRGLDEPLYRSQIMASDFVALSKRDLIELNDLTGVKLALERVKPGVIIVDTDFGEFPSELLFSAQLHTLSCVLPRRYIGSQLFQTMSWTSDLPLVPGRFQIAVSKIASKVVRGKGLVYFVGAPGQPMLFHFIGNRATVAPAPSGVHVDEVSKLVFISREGGYDEADLKENLLRCVASSDEM
jgi:G3E family GTPase